MPLYPKLRSAAHELFEAAVGLLPLVSSSFTQIGEDLAAEFFFERSGRYLSGLYRESVAPHRLREFLRSIALSRYVGVIRWLVDGEPLLDTIWDTTDRLRETRVEEHLLGMVAFRPQDWATVDKISRRLGIVAG